MKLGRMLGKKSRVLKKMLKSCCYVNKTFFLATRRNKLTSNTISEQI